MGYAAFRLTPEIINELIDAGHLVLDDDFYSQPKHISIPNDAKVFIWSFNGGIAPLGEVTVVLEHENLLKVVPGAVFPYVAIKVNK